MSVQVILNFGEHTEPLATYGDSKTFSRLWSSEAGTRFNASTTLHSETDVTDLCSLDML